MAIFNKILFRNKNRLLTGFTLVEMLVAVAIFATTVTVVSTIFVSAIQTQRQSLAYQELLDQTSYLMEYMSRAIRMAKKDDIGILGFPPKNCLSDNKINYEFSNQCLKFRNYKNQCQEFCLTAGKIEEHKDGSLTGDLTSGLTVKPLTGFSDWIKLSGETQNDNLQPLVSIFLEITGKEQSKIQIQTSISQRDLDVQK